MRPLRIGNAHGFWGDRIGAAAQLLQLEPDLDVLTLDFLAEVSMSILAAQQQRNSERGYAADFVDVVRSLTPYWSQGGKCRVVTNAGGLNPWACGLACHEVLKAAGCGDRTVAVVTGDDVLPLLQGGNSSFRNLDSGKPLSQVVDQLMTANAYLGAESLLEALEGGADLIITGRVADPSLTVAPCIQHFGWSTKDYDRIAGATVAGHLIECGAQVTGGISTDWLNVPGLDTIGFPIVEVRDDGSCVVTKGTGSGGHVTETTVKEQLVYEIGDPANYLSPDATVSFESLKVQQMGRDRVHVRGALGSAPPATYKVSATYRDGFWAAGRLVVCGIQAIEKARAAAEVVRHQLQSQGALPNEFVVELLGAGGSRMAATANPSVPENPPPEVVLRIAVADSRRDVVETFTRAMTPLITAGPPGTTGYADGRPKVHPKIGYWPCLVDCQALNSQVRWVTSRSRRAEADTLGAPCNSASSTEEGVAPAVDAHDGLDICANSRGRLIEFACARSGDKGINANIGVIARREAFYPALRDWLTAQRVADYFGLAAEDVHRYELPNLQAFNFILKGILQDGLRTDAQGKALAQWLLLMPCETFPGEL